MNWQSSSQEARALRQSGATETAPLYIQTRLQMHLLGTILSYNILLLILYSERFRFIYAYCTAHKYRTNQFINVNGHYFRMNMNFVTIYRAFFCWLFLLGRYSKYNNNIVCTNFFKIVPTYF